MVQWTYTPDFRGGLAVEHTRSISFVAGMTMVTECSHQTEPTEEQHYVPKGEN